MAGTDDTFVLTRHRADTKTDSKTGGNFNEALGTSHRTIRVAITTGHVTVPTKLCAPSIVPYQVLAMM